MAINITLPTAGGTTPEELDQHLNINRDTGSETKVLTEKGTMVELPINPGVIDMKPGEYLSDYINAINALPEEKKPTVETPITIKFYNHNKTMRWETYTGLVHVPEHVYLEFVGRMSTYDNNDFFTNSFSLGKMFLGFSFEREANHIQSGLPANFSDISLSQKYEEQCMLDDLSELDDFKYSDLMYEDEPFVFVGETYQAFLVKNDDSKIEVTVSLKNAYLGKSVVSRAMRYVNCQSADFSSANCQSADFISANCQSANFNSANCQSAYFNSANCQSADFNSANCQSANFNSANCQSADFISANCQSAGFISANCQSAGFYYANCQSADFSIANCQSANFNSANLKNAIFFNIQSIAGANFRNADMTGLQYLPERINTKAKFIAECGAINVNAGTTWIDGTSILD